MPVNHLPMNWKSFLTPRNIAILIIALYLLPAFFQVNFDEDSHITNFYLGLPRIQSGDEPQYYAMLYSLVNDHNIYLENNYYNSQTLHACDFGLNFAKKKILDSLQRYIPAAGISLSAIELKEQEESLTAQYGDFEKHFISSHPLGLPFLSALLFFPFSGTCTLEHLVLFLSIFCSLLGVYYLYKILLYYTHEQTALLFTILYALATPLWFYSKTYFTEPYVATILIISYYLFAIKKKLILPGILLGLSFLMKFTMGMYPVIFVLLLFIESGVTKENMKKAFLFFFPTLIAIGLFFLRNLTFYGNILDMGKSQPSYFGTTALLNLFFGSVKTLFAQDYGLFLFAPFLLFVFIAIPTIYRQNKKLFASLILLIAPYFFYMALFTNTLSNGPGGYGPRYLIVVIPFLILLLATWYDTIKSLRMKGFFFAFVALSVLINFFAAFFHFLYWSSPPWEILLVLLNKNDRILALLQAYFGIFLR